jgi:hypothetical protein
MMHFSSATLGSVVLALTLAFPGAAVARSHVRAETTGSVAYTWSNYRKAAGHAGRMLRDHQTVQISCRHRGFKVTDGNVWWYRIASAPWKGHYYVSADAFYNDGKTSGSLLRTPFYDRKVPVC